MGKTMTKAQRNSHHKYKDLEIGRKQKEIQFSQSEEKAPPKKVEKPKWVPHSERIVE